MSDITKHKWSDDDIQGVSIDATHILIESSCEDNTLDKSDAIAIAKHFGLSGKDLK